MKNWTPFLLLSLCISCQFNKTPTKMEIFDEILSEFDLMHTQTPGKYYPKNLSSDYCFFHFPMDLEHGYFYLAGSRIHLYGDSVHWAVVLEKNGFGNRSGYGEVELNYVGNCIKLIVKKYSYISISNTKYLQIIDFNEIEGQMSKQERADLFEQIPASAKTVTIRDKVVEIDHDLTKYDSLKIELDSETGYEKRLIPYEGFVRFLYETQPDLLWATESELRSQLPEALPKIATLDEFHYYSAYDETIIPSQQELIRLIAEVLVSCDSSKYKPTLPPNNYWRNWDSGNL